MPPRLHVHSNLPPSPYFHLVSYPSTSIPSALPSFSQHLPLALYPLFLLLFLLPPFSFPLPLTPLLLLLSLPFFLSPYPGGFQARGFIIPYGEVCLFDWVTEGRDWKGGGEVCGASMSLEHLRVILKGWKGLILKYMHIHRSTHRDSRTHTHIQTQKQQ